MNMLEFAELAAADTGIHDLGYWAGLTPIEGYGDFGAKIVQAPTLYGAIQAYCGDVRSECSTAEYYLRHEGSSAWFCHGAFEGQPLGPQHELYALMVMMQVVHLALGRDWRPSSICLQRADETGLTDNAFLLDQNIKFGSAYTGIAIDLCDLATPIRHPKNIAPTPDLPQPTRSSTPLAVDLLAAVQTLVAAEIHQSHKPSVERVAKMLGYSTRTLRRYLKSQATSYSGLVDHVRFELALPMLRDDSVTLTEIAHELGYSHVAHFSRAFSRLAGMSPRLFRSRLKG